MLPGMIQARGASVVAAGAFDLSFVTNAVQTTALTTYTFSSQSLGVADASRYIIVAAGGLTIGGQTIDSITVGGVSATVVNTVLGTQNARASMWIAAVPTGTTGDVVVTFSSGGSDNCGIAIWRLVGAISSTATDTQVDGTLSSSALSASLTIPTGGAGIGYTFVIVSNRTFTWTNMGAVDDFDVIIETNAGWHTGTTNTTAGAATRTVTASGSLTNGGTLILAAWN